MKIIRLIALVITILFYQNLSSQIFISDTNVCGNTQVTFKDIHLVPPGKTVVKRYWDFDGVNKDTTVDDSVDFTFANTIAGSQSTVSLMVEYDDASTATFTRVVRIWALPVIDSFKVNRNITCPGVQLRFETYSHFEPVKGAFLTNWAVEFGDLNASNPAGSVDNNVLHTYGAMGLYKAIYTVTDAKGCVSKSNLEIRIIQTPIVQFIPINPRCKDSVVLYENRTAGRDTTWVWQWTFVDSQYIKGSIGQDSFVVNAFKQINGTGKIFENTTHKHPWFANFSKSIVVLVGTNQYGCRDSSDIFTTNVDTTPTLVFTPRADTTICFGESVQYTVRGSDTIWYENFQWGNKISGDSIVLFTPKNTTTYKVFGKTPQCSPTSKDIKITVVPPIESKVKTEPQYILRGAVSKLMLTTNGILDSLVWNPDSTLTRPRFDSTGAAPKFTTTYKVKYYFSLNNYVCSQEDSATIFVNTDCQVDSLKIPTAFSPNGDALNDEFYVKSFSLKTILSFNVYNRWGNNVFKVENVPADDKQYYWNGKINNNGDDVPLGVYVYNISAICKNDQILNFQGEITVLR
jgi:gliding motility-associated-like protein